MKEIINEKGLRIDGRAVDELRPIKIEVGVLKNANGSCYIEFGKNKIMVAVFGPQEVHPKHLALPDRSILRCRYHMSPFSTDTRKHPQPSRREIEISKLIRESLEPSIILEEYPRTSINVYLEVLQADGGTRCAGITATSVALADAGIPMRDMVVACAVGKVAGQIVIDLNDTEDKEGEADMPIAMMLNLNKISLLQLDGNLTQEEFNKAIDMALIACKRINDIQRQALFNKYFSTNQVDGEQCPQ